MEGGREGKKEGGGEALAFASSSSVWFEPGSRYCLGPFTQPSFPSLATPALQTTVPMACGAYLLLKNAPQKTRQAAQSHHQAQTPKHCEREKKRGEEGGVE